MEQPAQQCRILLLKSSSSIGARVSLAMVQRQVVFRELDCSEVLRPDCEVGRWCVRFGIYPLLAEISIS